MGHIEILQVLFLSHSTSSLSLMMIVILSSPSLKVIRVGAVPTVVPVPRD